MYQVNWKDFIDVSTKIDLEFNEATPIRIWGSAPQYNSVLMDTADRQNNIKIFDNEQAGSATAIGNYPIQAFSVDSVTAEDQENAVFVLAFGIQELNQNAMAILNKLGVKYYFNVHDFQLVYQIKKVYKDYQDYTKINTDPNFQITEKDSWLITSDWLTSAGVELNDAYLVQDLWGANRIFENMPKRHFDIGSRVDGLITHLLAFNLPTTLIDIRPLETYNTENLDFINADATNLENIASNSIESLSALCSLEHFGLGRYGDTVDPNSHLKAFKSIQRVLQSGGNLYISVPVFSECLLQFNAHRVYTTDFIIKHFEAMELIEFSLSTENGLLKNAPLDLAFLKAPTVGLFHFRKIN